MCICILYIYMYVYITYKLYNRKQRKKLGYPLLARVMNYFRGRPEYKA